MNTGYFYVQVTIDLAIRGAYSGNRAAALRSIDRIIRRWHSGYAASHPFSRADVEFLLTDVCAAAPVLDAWIEPAVIEVRYA